MAGDGELAALVEGYRRRVARLSVKVLGSTETGLTRGSASSAGWRPRPSGSSCGVDAAVVDYGALRADIDLGPITYGEVAEAPAYDHPVM